MRTHLLNTSSETEVEEVSFSNTGLWLDGIVCHSLAHTGMGLKRIKLLFCVSTLTMTLAIFGWCLEIWWNENWEGRSLSPLSIHIVPGWQKSWTAVNKELYKEIWSHLIFHVKEEMNNDNSKCRSKTSCLLKDVPQNIIWPQIYCTCF